MNSAETRTPRGDILIVDDKLPNLRLLSNMLKEQEYKVRAVPSGEMALTAVSSAPPDLVLLDINMPEMDGYEVCTRIKASDHTKEIPVIFVSALDEAFDKVKAFSVGGVDYVTKPFQIEEVLARIETHLALRGLQKDLQAANEHLERRVQERTLELQLRLLELEARDELLRHLLSLQEPKESLELSVNLALGLCSCDSGALYMPADGATFGLQVGVGYFGNGESLSLEQLEGTGLGDVAEIGPHLEEALKGNKPVWVRDPGRVRSEFGIHSFGILPVRRKDDVVALLEVDRKQKDVLVGKADLGLLEGFLPYVAMAVTECNLQDEIPGWQEGVDQMLKATEKWQE